MNKSRESAFSRNNISLDDRYFAFRNATQPVFDQYPQLVPLRPYIYKELLVRKEKLSLVGITKHVLRPLKSRRRTMGDLQTAEVVIWLESDREVIVDTLLPVYAALVELGIRVVVLSYNRLKPVPVSTVTVEYPARIFPPRWTNPAWHSLVQSEPALNYPATKTLFSFACALEQGFQDELERIIDIIRPQVIVTASTNIEGGAALSVVARKNGIKSLVLQHGIAQVFYTPIVADFIFTWGKTSSETLARLGVPLQQIITIGSPRHDGMGLKNNPEARKTLLSLFGLDDRPTFIFFSNGNDSDRNSEAPVECARWLESLACEFQDQLNVVVRLHPNETGVLYKDCPHLHITKNVPDLAITLEGCDWSGSLCSSVLNEALLYHKPVWQLYADGWPDLADNWKTGLADRISSLNDLCQKTADLLSACRDNLLSLAEQVFVNHGQATFKVAVYIRDLIKT